MHDKVLESKMTHHKKSRSNASHYDVKKVECEYCANADNHKSIKAQHSIDNANKVLRHRVCRLESSLSSTSYRHRNTDSVAKSIMKSINVENSRNIATRAKLDIVRQKVDQLRRQVVDRNCSVCEGGSDIACGCTGNGDQICDGNCDRKIRYDVNGMREVKFYGDEYNHVMLYGKENCSPSTQVASYDNLNGSGFKSTVKIDHGKFYLPKCFMRTGKVNTYLTNARETYKPKTGCLTSFGEKPSDESPLTSKKSNSQSESQILKNRKFSKDSNSAFLEGKKAAILNNKENNAPLRLLPKQPTGFAISCDQDNEDFDYHKLQNIDFEFHEDQTSTLKRQPLSEISQYKSTNEGMSSYFTRNKLLNQQHETSSFLPGHSGRHEFTSATSKVGSGIYCSIDENSDEDSDLLVRQSLRMELPDLEFQIE